VVGCLLCFFTGKDGGLLLAEICVVWCLCLFVYGVVWSVCLVCVCVWCVLCVVCVCLRCVEGECARVYVDLLCVCVCVCVCCVCVCAAVVLCDKCVFLCMSVRFVRVGV